MRSSEIVKIFLDFLSRLVAATLGALLAFAILAWIGSLYVKSVIKDFEKGFKDRSPVTTNKGTP